MTGYLPGHSFPVDVVQFNYTTIESINFSREKKTTQREDQMAMKNGYPSRNLSIAIRDYAPGNDVVVDGRVYKSGVTLNWHIPIDSEQVETQALKWAWNCQKCYSKGIKITMPRNCPNCGNIDIKKEKYLQPGGFAVDIRSKPGNDVSNTKYIPVRDPWVSASRNSWVNLPGGHVRYRSDDHGSIFHYSDGLHGKNYQLCLVCGKADSITETNKDPLNDHKRLRGGKQNDHESVCPGNEINAIKELKLGVESNTDVFELQLKYMDSKKF